MFQLKKKKNKKLTEVAQKFCTDMNFMNTYNTPIFIVWLKFDFFYLVLSRFFSEDDSVEINVRRSLV